MLSALGELFSGEILICSSHQNPDSHKLLKSALQKGSYRYSNNYLSTIIGLISSIKVPIGIPEFFEDDFVETNNVSHISIIILKVQQKFKYMIRLEN